MSTTTKPAQTEEQKVKKTDIWKPKFSQIKIEPELNIRTDYGDIKALADNIRENGVKVALRGYRDGDKFVPVDGHRRTAAAKLLFEEGLDIEMPFIIEAKGTNQEQRIIDMFITNDGKHLNPLEMAEGIKRLLNYGWKEKEIAAKLSKSEGYIRKLNSLNSAPKKFTNLILEGVISSTFAISMIAEGEEKVNSFIAEYEGGKYEPVKEEKNYNDNDQPEEDNRLFEHEKEIDAVPAPVKRVTKKKVEPLNSLKEFKKIAKALDTDSLSDELTLNQADVFLLVKRIVDNEITREELIACFSTPVEAKEAA